MASQRFWILASHTSPVILRNWCDRGPGLASGLVLFTDCFWEQLGPNIFASQSLCTSIRCPLADVNGVQNRKATHVGNLNSYGV